MKENIRRETFSTQVVVLSSRVGCGGTKLSSRIIFDRKKFVVSTKEKKKRIKQKGINFLYENFTIWSSVSFIVD